MAMKNWLKKNWFRVGLLLALVVLSGVIYFVYANWRANANAAESLKMAQQCNQDGQKLLKADQDTATSLQYQGNATACYYMDPAYVYNQKLNTCLYSGGYTCNLINIITSGFLKGQPATSWTRHIIDVYSNNTLAEVSVAGSSNITSVENNMVKSFWDESNKLGFQ
jgi:hypothetical protein